MDARIDRKFVRLDEGLVHLRWIEPVVGSSARPLWLIHASPGSSRGLETLMLGLRAAGVTGAILAPDTLGNGDSAAPAPEQPEIDYFAGSVVRLCDALGYETIDLYGAHTGARIACEIAAAFPQRVGKVVMDGIAEYSPELRDETLAHYAPAVAPDEYGRQLIWAFHFVRDMSLHFPYFKRDAAHRLSGPVPSPKALHLSAIDVLKALGTYHLAYLAVFRYAPSQRIPLIQAPALFLRADNELPILQASADALSKLLPSPQAQVARISGAVDGKAAVVAAFVNSSGQPRASRDDRDGTGPTWPAARPGRSRT